MAAYNEDYTNNHKYTTEHQAEDNSYEHDTDGNADDGHTGSNAETATHGQGGESSGHSERVQHLEEQLAYLRADFENYRRNVEKEKKRWKEEAQSKILLDLLSVVDDFDRAVADLESEDVSEDVYKRIEGIKLIYKSVLKLLEEYDVHEITQVETFDPQWHEAVMQVSETDVPSGNIVSVIQKGYTFKGNLLRTAKVTVAQ